MKMSEREDNIDKFRFAEKKIISTLRRVII